MKIEFENLETKREQILAFLNSNGIASLEDAKSICEEKGLDLFKMVKGIQPISFDDAGWAYTCGAAVAIKKNNVLAKDAAVTLGDALQAFCQKGSVADERKVGEGHGRIAAMLLDDNTGCFAFLAGHESFAAAEGAIAVAESANKVRKKPLRVILNGLGKDAAEIIARVNGFTYVRTKFDFATDTLTIVDEIVFSNGPNSKIRCYGAFEMREGVAIMEHEDVDISISGNATNMIRFQHPVAGAYKHKSNMAGKNYFACASGGGIGRTLNPDDTSAGPASYGLTDMMSRMYADATFAGSSSVPAHVAMMGYIGMGNNPMVGATVAVAATIEETLSKK